MGVLGQYGRFLDVRNEVHRDFMESAHPQLCPVAPVSILVSGIFVGEPEDLLNFRKNRGTIMYPTKGLGEKLADIRFL